MCVCKPVCVPYQTVAHSTLTHSRYPTSFSSFFRRHSLTVTTPPPPGPPPPAVALDVVRKALQESDAQQAQAAAADPGQQGGWDWPRSSAFRHASQQAARALLHAPCFMLPRGDSARRNSSLITTPSQQLCPAPSASQAAVDESADPTAAAKMMKAAVAEAAAEAATLFLRAAQGLQRPHGSTAADSSSDRLHQQRHSDCDQSPLPPASTHSPGAASALVPSTPVLMPGDVGASAWAPLMLGPALTPAPAAAGQSHVAYPLPRTPALTSSRQQQQPMSPLSLSQSGQITTPAHMPRQPPQVTPQPFDLPLQHGS